MKLEVYLQDRKIGTLSDEAGVGGIPFQYAGDWLEEGFNISPFALDWSPRVQWREGDRTFEQIAAAAAAWETIAIGAGISESRFREIRDAWDPVIGTR